MQSIIIILVAVFIMVSVIKKVRDAHEKRPGGHDAPGRDNTAPALSKNAFSERVRRNPTNSAAWSDWGFSLLQEALGAEKDPKSRVALIDAANSKLATAHELNLRDYDVPHEWAVALGYACAGCDADNREKYLAKAMELARTSFEKISKRDIYYYYDWAEMLSTIAPLFPEAKQRRILGEAFLALSKPDKEAIDDGDYYTLWIETGIRYALLSPKEQRVGLLKQAYSLYKEVPEDEKEALPGGLEKRIQAELEKARSVRDEPADTGNAVPGHGIAPGPVDPAEQASSAGTAAGQSVPPRSHPYVRATAPVTKIRGGSRGLEEDDLIDLDPPLPVSAQDAASPPSPRDDEAKFALLAPQFDARAPSAPASPAGDAAASGQTAVFPPPSFDQHPADAPLTPPFPDTVPSSSGSSYSGSSYPGSTPLSPAGRELPEYARPKGQHEEGSRAPSTPSGYKPINYKRS